MITQIVKEQDGKLGPRANGQIEKGKRLREGKGLVKLQVVMRTRNKGMVHGRTRTLPMQMLSHPIER
jgi:hypothetical protein